MKKNLYIYFHSPQCRIPKSLFHRSLRFQLQPPWGLGSPVLPAHRGGGLRRMWVCVRVWVLGLCVVQVITTRVRVGWVARPALNLLSKVDRISIKDCLILNVDRLFFQAILLRRRCLAHDLLRLRRGCGHK